MQLKWTPELPKKKESIKSEIFEADKRTFQLVITNQEDNIYMTIEYFGNSYADIITLTKLSINAVDKDYPYSFNRYNNVFTFVIPSMKFYKIAAGIRIFPNPYKSKVQTGFSGMRNLGATCYMNSYLQLLFHISEFTSQLFKQKPNKKTFQLQRLFYKLMNDDDVDTRSFVNNCQWFCDVFTHQDVHEFGKLVFDAIELENKKKPESKDEAPPEFFIDDLFQGTFSNYVVGECGCESSVKDNFFEIQLEIRDWLNNVIADNIEDGFKRLKNIEKLEGDNKYRCEKHGLVNAIKGSSISQLPPILTVLLKRFSVDYNTGESKKINDKYTFSEFITVGCEGRNEESGKEKTEEVKKLIEGSVPLDDDPIHKDIDKKKYKLFGVVVHSGAVADGHYYCYLNIDGWYKFNDTIIMKVSEDEAIFDNFGGTHPYKLNEKIHSAYLLIYIDVEKWSGIVNKKIEIESFVKEKILESESGKVISLNLITKKDIISYKGAGLFEKSKHGFMEIHHKSVPARSDDTLYVLFKNTTKRHNYIYDALSFQPLSNDECVVEDRCYYLHSEPKKRKSGDILIFLKRYRYQERCVQEAGYGFEIDDCFLLDENLLDIESVMERMGLSKDYLFFIEERIERNDLITHLNEAHAKELISHDLNSKNLIDKEIDKLINEENAAKKRFRNNESLRISYEIRPFNSDITFKENRLTNGSILIACKSEDDNKCMMEYKELMNRQYICLRTSVGDIDLYLNSDYTYDKLFEYLKRFFLSENINIVSFDGTLRENAIQHVKVDIQNNSKFVIFADGSNENNLNNIYHLHYMCLDQLTVKFLYQKISMLKCIKDELNRTIQKTDIPCQSIKDEVEVNNTFNKMIYDKIKESYQLIEIYENSPYYNEYSSDDKIDGTGRLILRKKSSDKIISLIYHNNDEFVGYPILININNISTVKDLRLKYNIATKLGKYNGKNIINLGDNDRIDNFTEIDVITNHGLD